MAAKNRSASSGSTSARALAVRDLNGGNRKSGKSKSAILLSEVKSKGAVT